MAPASERKLMSCINDVRLVGRLTKDPQFQTTANGKRYARLTVETERYVRINGQRKRDVQEHQVVCFNQFSLEPLREFARAGTVVKVLGELTYRNGRAEIVVGQYVGEVGIMTFGAEPQPDPATPPASETVAARGTGGLGRLPRNEDSGSDGFPGDTGGSPAGDILDDEIPF